MIAQYEDGENGRRALYSPGLYGLSLEPQAPAGDAEDCAGLDNAAGVHPHCGRLLQGHGNHRASCTMAS